MQNLAEKIKIGPYEVLSELGRGFDGAVYLVEFENKKFAIKMPLANDNSDLASMDRFRTEAYALARFNHSSLINVFEVGDQNGIPYLVMEYIEGASLLEEIQNKGRFANEEIIKLGIAIAGALTEIHRFSLVHRDVKPLNIILGLNGKIKLIDLGMVGGAEAIREDQERNVVLGTIQYSAPEQLGVIKTRVDGRSDLYSLGVTLFQAATGKLPFEASDFSELIRQHAVQIAQVPKELNSDLDPVLSKIISKLLMKDPDDRYQSARGLIYDLENSVTFKERLIQHPEAKLELGAKDFQLVGAEAPLGGRKAELIKLKDCLESTISKKGGAVILQAESGMGKSRLARKLVEEAIAQGLFILQSKCSDKAKTIPMSVLKDALESLLRWAQKNQNSEGQNALEKIRNASIGLENFVKRISPHLSSQLNLAKVNESTSQDIGQDQFVVQAVEFFTRLSQNSKGIVLYIDDVQWADEITISFLQLLLQHVGSLKIQILLSLRSENLESFKEFSGGRSIIESKATTIIKLGPLDFEDIELILKNLLGHKKIDSQTVKKISQATEGNPYLIQEMTYGALESGYLSLIGEEWRLNFVLASGINFSEDASKLFLKRTAKLPKEYLVVFQYCALIGASFQAEIISEVSGVTLQRVEDALQDGLRLSFFEIDNVSGNYRFFHDKIREAITADFDIEKLKSFYDSIAIKLDKYQTEENSNIYEIARYYRLSNWERHIDQAFSRNCQAGFLLAQNYAYEASIEVFLYCLNLSKKMDIAKTLIYQIQVALGTSSMNLGLHTEARKYFTEASEYTADDIEKAKIQFLECRTLSGEGSYGLAWEKMKLSLAQIGYSYSGKTYAVVWALLVAIICYIFLLLTSWNYGNLKKSKKYAYEIKRHELIAQILETGGYLSYNLGKQLDLANITFRLYLNSFPLGDSRELGQSESAIAVVWALAVIKPLMNFHLRRARVIAEKINDPALNAYIKCQNVWCLEFSGATLESDQASLQAIPEVKKYLGSWMISTLILDLGGQYLNRGKVREALEFINSVMPVIDKANNYAFMANARSMLYSQSSFSGNFSNLFKVYNEAEDYINKAPTALYAAAIKTGNVILVLWDQNDFGEKFENALRDYFAFKLEDFHLKMIFCALVYGRLSQYEHAKPDQKNSAKKNLKAALLSLRLRASIPLFKCHLRIVEGAFLRVDGQLAAATEKLEDGFNLARIAGSELGMSLAALEKARLERVKGNHERASIESQYAFSIAKKVGLANRAEQISREFKLTSESMGLQILSNNRPKGSSTIETSFNERRILDSLLKVSLASSTTIDTVGQIRAVLDEILVVFGAERGFVFTVEEKTNEFRFQGGRTANKNDIEIPEGYASTTVKNVFKDKKPIVVTNSDELLSLDSKSAIHHDLRSIMAVPLMLKEKMMGVMYVDSRLTKGLFTQSDVVVFNAIGNHIAISLESSRQAKVEAERREMEKDLEVSAAVQNMLLPASTLINHNVFGMASFYRPATKCGGDWWSYLQDQEKLMIFVGDVTGHGAGAAMITSSIATAFRIYHREMSEAPLEDILNKMNLDFISFAKGEYLMTGMAIIFDLNTRVVRWFAMGGPQIVVTKSGGEKTVTFGDVSSPLGTEDFTIATGEYILQPGDRMFIITDGIIEMQSKEGRTLSNRQFLMFLEKLKLEKIEKISDKLSDQLFDYSGDKPQDDDYTLVALELNNI